MPYCTDVLKRDGLLLFDNLTKSPKHELNKVARQPRKNDGWVPEGRKGGKTVGRKGWIKDGEEWSWSTGKKWERGNMGKKWHKLQGKIN